MQMNFTQLFPSLNLFLPFLYCFCTFEFWRQEGHGRALPAATKTERSWSFRFRFVYKHNKASAGRKVQRSLPLTPTEINGGGSLKLRLSLVWKSACAANVK